MGTSINVNGLASGVQWQTLVDQLSAADKARTVTPLQDQITSATRRRTAWNELSGLVQKLQDASNALKLGSAFKNYAATASASSQTNRALLTTSATAAAVPGAYRVEVVDLARAEKLSGSVMSSATTALGFAGSFSVAGQGVTVAATDTLEGVRDKINALNTGATATKVTASILSTAPGEKRLVLSADAAGSGGTALTDGTEGVLRDLGFADSRSRAMSSASLAIAAALGVTMPPPSSITVAGRTISVDLSVDSISSIIAKIRAVGGQAEIQSESVGGVPSHRLSVGGAVTATGDPNSAATIAALGFAAGGQSTVQQVVASGQAFQDASNAAASGATLLTDLRAGGASLGVNVGDTLSFTGMRGDGSAVSVSFVVGGADTLDTLLSKLNDNTTGFGSGTRPAKATIDPDGKLRLNDQTGGDSRLRLAMMVAPGAGGTPTALLGSFGTETVGRARAMVVGSDAQLKVDGVLFTRSTNSVSDAIDGVTLNLLQSEPGSEVDVTVTRDQDAAVKAVKSFVEAYNNIVSFSAGQQLSGQPLASNGALRRMLGSFTQALRTEVLAAGDYSKGTLVGMTLTRSGSLELNETTLKTALGANLSGIQSLFGSAGIGDAMYTAAQSATRAVDGTIPSLLTSIDTANSRLTRRAAELQARVDQRREGLILRFTAMETAIGRLQQQSSSLASVLNNSSN